jgi:hypothetical protein
MPHPARYLARHHLAPRRTLSVEIEINQPSTVVARTGPDFVTGRVPAWLTSIHRMLAPMRGIDNRAP